ncbi:MAG: sigma-70 family RNA polymerase sigma factor [Candidatus Hydrogenedentes bacterium]|nr:sigma-70 family RNA polymerase sigma factor [Candidatus Hydrogenedentota bacterium]
MSSDERLDEELMALVRKGDQSIFAELVRRYQNDLFRFCLHYLKDVERSKELTQEAFVRVYVARDRFDDSRRFRPWILCIARNLCLNEIKRKKTVPMESLEEYASTAREASGEILRSSSDGPSEMLAAAERRELLVKALDGLDSDSREIVTLRFFERMQARDIAEIVGSSEGAVRTKLHRILKSLREKYHDLREHV